MNEAKLKAATALLLHRTQSSKLKLLKLLYLADFTAHWELGQSITGDVYEHWRHGPVPKHLWTNFDAVTNNSTGDEPDVSSLSAAELTILDRVVRDHGGMTGQQLRRLTHDSVPYRATALGGEIPYFLAPYRRISMDGNGVGPFAGVQVTAALQRAVAEIVKRPANASV